MPKSIPTLTPKGWVNTIEEKADAALSYFLTSEYSQSVLYEGEISSLPYLIKEYNKDIQELESQTQEALARLMRRYFGEDAADTRVSVVETEEADDNPGAVRIRFNCTVQEDGQEYTIARRVEFVDGALKEIQEINNG